MSRLLLTFVATALTLASIRSATTTSATTLSAPADQYATYPRRPHVELLKSSRRFDGDPPSSSSTESALDNDIVPDLQVGCGDGLLVETTSKTTPRPVESKLKEIFARKERRKRESGEDRKPRSYFTYSIYTPASLSYSASLNYKTVFKPAPYVPQRPYYIPVWGSQGKLPIYYPPQLVFPPPEFPFDKIPGEGSFLESKPTTPPTTTTSSTTIGLFNRFKEDEPVVWDSRPAQPEVATTTAATQREPTRRPSGPKTSTFPPLIHKTNPTSASALEEAPLAPEMIPPPPSAAPNKCAFAIVSCCSAGSSTVRDACFERQGCPGPFWGTNPCEGDFANKAVNYVLNHYDSK